MSIERRTPHYNNRIRGPSKLRTFIIAVIAQTSASSRSGDAPDDSPLMAVVSEFAQRANFGQGFQRLVIETADAVFWGSVGHGNHPVWKCAAEHVAAMQLRGDEKIDPADAIAYDSRIEPVAPQ